MTCCFFYSIKVNKTSIPPFPQSSGVTKHICILLYNRSYLYSVVSFRADPITNSNNISSALLFKDNFHYISAVVFCHSLPPYLLSCRLVTQNEGFSHTVQSTMSRLLKQLYDFVAYRCLCDKWKTQTVIPPISMKHHRYAYHLM